MSEVVAILQLMSAEGIGARKLSRLLRRLDAERRSAVDLVEARDDELTADYKFTAAAVEAMRTSKVSAEALAHELDENAVRMLTLRGPGYPEVLIDRLSEEGAPPVMFVHGNIEALERVSVGFCGPRDVSEKGAAAVVELAALTCKEGLTVVSGFAGGVDTAAHVSCLQSGGVTVAVLPTGILHFRPSSVYQDLADEGNCLVVSEFHPRAGWSAGYAMQRNRTVCGLSGAVMIIEPKESGGTFQAGKTALEIKRPLFLARPESEARPTPGEEYFIRHGAVPLIKEEGIWVTEALFSAARGTERVSGGSPSLFD